jgi:hypothetical protein
MKDEELVEAVTAATAAAASAVPPLLIFIRSMI